MNRIASITIPVPPEVADAIEADAARGQRSGGWSERWPRRAMPRLIL